MGFQTGRPPDERFAVVVEAHFHLGELYFVMPFLSSITYEPGQRVCLLFTSQLLYEQFLGEPMLVRAAESIDAEIIVVPARPEVPARRVGRLRALARSMGQRAAWPARRKLILGVLARTDLLLTQTNRGYAEEALGRRRNGRPMIVRYPHTSASQIVNLTEAKRRVWSFRQAGPGQTILLLDPDAVPYYALYGFARSVVLGYHTLTRSWLDMVAELAPWPGEHAIIYSFSARDDILPAEKWRELHRSTYRAIRRLFPELPIVIKPHPNQDPDSLREFIDREGWKGAEVVVDHPMLAAYGARFCVSFLTGGIYNAMLLNVPSINYFNAHEDYIRGHGAYMQDYPSLGAPDVEDEAGLIQQLERVRDGELTIDFGTRRARIPRVQTFSDFLRLLET